MTRDVKYCPKEEWSPGVASTNCVSRVTFQWHEEASSHEHNPLALQPCLVVLIVCWKVESALLSIFKGPEGSFYFSGF